MHITKTIAIAVASIGLMVPAAAQARPRPDTCYAGTGIVTALGDTSCPLAQNEADSTWLTCQPDDTQYSCVGDADTGQSAQAFCATADAGLTKVQFDLDGLALGVTPTPTDSSSGSSDLSSTHSERALSNRRRDLTNDRAEGAQHEVGVQGQRGRTGTVGATGAPGVNGAYGTNGADGTSSVLTTPCSNDPAVWLPYC